MFSFQQVAGKLEIRVVPKELVNKSHVIRPQSLSPSKVDQSGEVDRIEIASNEGQDSPQKTKFEKTKGILKQNSKEKEAGDMPSPRRENITFAPTNECHKRGEDDVIKDKEILMMKACENRDVDRETQCDIRKDTCFHSLVSTGTEAVDLEKKTLDKHTGQWERFFKCFYFYFLNMNILLLLLLIF